MSNEAQIEELKRVVRNLQVATNEFANTLLDFSKIMSSDEIKAIISEFGKEEYKAQNAGVFKNNGIVNKKGEEPIIPSSHTITEDICSIPIVRLQEIDEGTIDRVCDAIKGLKKEQKEFDKTITTFIGKPKQK